MGWSKRTPKDAGEWAFTHHRDARWNLSAGVLSTLIVVEGVAVHLWLAGAGYTIAMWSAAIVHVYLLIWVLGDAHALRLFATRVSTQADGSRVIALRIGLRGRADIPVARVVEATTGTWDEAAPDGELVSVSGFATVHLTFDGCVDFVPMLGKPVGVSSLRVQIDDPERFVRVVRQ
jgi:hypothetical protein